MSSNDKIRLFVIYVIVYKGDILRIDLRPHEQANFLLLFGLNLYLICMCCPAGDGCGPSVLGPVSGTLSSLGYPRTYPNDTVCEWEISVPRGSRIHFHFAELDIENRDCQVAYLRLYDGIGPKRSVIDLITCLDKGSDFPEAEFSKYCPAGCLTSTEEISGTIPNGYRESSPLCLAAIHAGVISNAVGGTISVVNSKGIHRYEATLANNVTSTGGSWSNSLFTFRTNGCLGTLGLASDGISDAQLSASSVWEWNGPSGQHNVWAPSGARLKKRQRPWSAAQNDQRQWLQIDLKREKRITGIITTGSTLKEYQYYVSEYQIHFSSDGEQWEIYREANSTQDKIFQGNNNNMDEVRNNFIPPIEARFVRVNPTRWHQRIALKLELHGCQIPHMQPEPRPRGLPPSDHIPPSARTKRPPLASQTTPPPDIRNTTMPPHGGKDVALAAVLVPVLVMVLTALVLIVVCARHWKNRKKSSEGTYDLPHWDRTDWWKSMKQLLPSKMVEAEDSVRYSSSEVGRLAGRSAVPRIHAEPAEYAQPLVSGVTTLGARSTFKPDEGPEPGYSDPDLYDTPISPDVYHAYAEPLPASGSEYATPIVVDMGCHPSGGSTLNQPCAFSGPASLLTRTDSSQSGRSAYDTPKNANGQATPTEDLTYQVPQNSTQKAAGQS
uniref:Discoidin, CUB and LCCL domain containing 2 n=1 Tax=Takifugu rubripes TaxID=31033 RepID=A0A674MW82_TAKRU